MKKLNWVQLQQALYDSWRVYDTPETKTAGRKQIRAVYAEYRHRGVTKVAVPRLP